jgi:hypothetical protein
VELKTGIRTQIALQKENTLYSCSGKPVSFFCTLCIHEGKYSFSVGVMTGNAKEKSCYFQQLEMAVYVTDVLKVFNPLVANLRTPEIFIVLNTSHKIFRLQKWSKHTISSTIRYRAFKYFMVDCISLNERASFKFIHG